MSLEEQQEIVRNYCSNYFDKHATESLSNKFNYYELMKSYFN